MMTRRQFISWLREYVPNEKWEQMWWLVPTVILLLLPLGAAILQVLRKLGWYGAPRATQGLILLSVVGGLVVGSLALWSVKEAGLELDDLRRAQWLARLAVVGPLFTLLIMFWIARIT